MRKSSTIGIALLVIAVAIISFVVLWGDGVQQGNPEGVQEEGAAAPQDREEENPFIVIITEEGFEPSIIEVEVGDRIVWFNEGTQPHWPASDVHPTHEAYPELDPQAPIAPGEIWEFVAGEVGEWTVHDHLESDNTATVIITE